MGSSPLIGAVSEDQLNSVLEALVGFMRGEFDPQLSVDNPDSVVDAIHLAINVAGEELERQHQAELEAKRLVLDSREELARRVAELEAAARHIKVLQGILPICMHCKKIRNDEASWQRVDDYIASNSEAEFTHGLCPECLEEHYPEEP